MCLVIGTPHLAYIAFSTPIITIPAHWYYYSSSHSQSTYYARYNKKWPHFKGMKVWFYHQFLKELFQCTKFVFNCNHSTIKLLIKCFHIMECQIFNWLWGTISLSCKQWRLVGLDYLQFDVFMRIMFIE
jgi:hypothetical protein